MQCDGCLYKKGALLRLREAGRTLCEDGSRDWTNTAEKPNILDITGKKQGRFQRELSPVLHIVELLHPEQ